MNNKYVITLLSAIIGIGFMFLGTKLLHTGTSASSIKVGFVYIGDTGTAYTNNYVRSQWELEDALGDKVETFAKYNIPEDDEICQEAIEDLVNQGCSLIFTTSFGFQGITKVMAAKYPKVQFCQATGVNANEGPILFNYHNFMGTIYEGRYLSGIAAGLKLKELIEQKKISPEEAKIGYVAAFPFAEVISGYTAFFLGIKSIVNEAKMTVIYTNTWSNHVIEKKYAERLINEGAIIIGQHSDTTGPAIACEEASTKNGKRVFHVGYNQSMTDVAPTTSLISSRINWTPYIVGATQAVLKGKRIENYMHSRLSGNDTAFGFDKGWVEIIGLNRLICPEETQAELEKYERLLKNKDLQVFKADFTGENPFDPTDIWNLKNPFPENKNSSAPQFHYVLRDVITIIE
ncbi:MAG: BMP family ABC transporter substrate-binding protein [Treponema sp.]|nr:BMP family ABC transporter substrate-binding protein [Treponema sp.]